MDYLERAQYWSQKIAEFKKTSSASVNKILAEDRRRVEILTQLKEVGWCYVKELESDLKFAILRVEDSNQEEGEFPLKINFPAKFPIEPFKIETHCELELAKSARIRDAYQAYVLKIDQFRPVRQIFEGLETRTRVIEAPLPDLAIWTPSRVIAIAPGICLEITIDPNTFEGVPKFIFLGPENKIKPLMRKITDDIEDYDAEESLADNLEKILGTYNCLEKICTYVPISSSFFLLFRNQFAFTRR